MEDAHIALLSVGGNDQISFFAVCDGHGGKKTTFIVNTINVSYSICEDLPGKINKIMSNFFEIQLVTETFDGF